MQTFAIIPAAGRSQRMGRPKLLLPWGATTILEHVLRQWRASRVSHVVLVVHSLDREVAEIGHRMQALVIAPDPPPAEMKASVREGLAAVQEKFQPAPFDAWLLAPADMPGLRAAVIDQLIDANRSSVESGNPPHAFAPSAAGRRGHPVLFPWSWAADVAQLGPDEGIDTLVARNVVETIEVPHSAIREGFEDIDTPADYERLRRRAGDR